MVDFKDIKVGDHIRATSQGTVVEADVLWVNEGRFGMGRFSIYKGDGWEIEVLEKPLPTAPGIYVEEDAHLADDPTYYKIIEGSEYWYTDSGSTWELIDDVEVPRNLVPLVKGTR